MDNIAQFRLPSDLLLGVFSLGCWLLVFTVIKGGHFHVPQRVWNITQGKH